MLKSIVMALALMSSTAYANCMISVIENKDDPKGTPQAPFSASTPVGKSFGSIKGVSCQMVVNIQESELSQYYFDCTYKGKKTRVGLGQFGASTSSSAVGLFGKDQSKPERLVLLACFNS